MQSVKGVPNDVMFGGVSVLAVGDLYQLPPVAQPMLFSTVRDSYAQLYKSGSIWQDEFEMLELDETMRQRGDSAFAELLCKVRTASYTNDDIAVLESRVVSPDSPVRHLFKRNLSSTRIQEFSTMYFEACFPVWCNTVGWFFSWHANSRSNRKKTIMYFGCPYTTHSHKGNFPLCTHLSYRQNFASGDGRPSIKFLFYYYIILVYPSSSLSLWPESCSNFLLRHHPRKFVPNPPTFLQVKFKHQSKRQP